MTPDEIQAKKLNKKEETMDECRDCYGCWGEANCHCICHREVPRNGETVEQARKRAFYEYIDSL